MPFQEVKTGKLSNTIQRNKMGYTAPAYIFIIGDMIMNGNLIWNVKLQQLEAAQTRVITFDAS